MKTGGRVDTFGTAETDSPRQTGVMEETWGSGGSQHIMKRHFIILSLHFYQSFTETSVSFVRA